MRGIIKFKKIHYLYTYICNIYFILKISFVKHEYNIEIIII